MENIRRNIKLFFVRHGNLILITILVIVGVILIVQFLEHRAKQIYLTDSKENTNQNFIPTLELQKIEKQKEIKSMKTMQIIEEFIDYCKNNEADKAYYILSTNCKNEKYPTIEQFKQDYLNNIFSQMVDYKIEKQEEGNICKVIFYTEDMLSSGKTNNRKKIEMYYKLIEDIDGIERLEI